MAEPLSSGAVQLSAADVAPLAPVRTGASGTPSWLPSTRWPPPPAWRENRKFTLVPVPARVMLPSARVFS